MEIKGHSEEMKLLNSLSKSFHKAYMDTDWLLKQTDRYLQDAEKISKKRFESFKLTYTTFVR